MVKKKILQEAHHFHMLISIANPLKRSLKKKRTEESILEVFSGKELTPTNELRDSK